MSAYRQEELLPAMKSAVEAAEATKRNYAYLSDRVMVEEGKPQHWGTQSHCEKKRALLYPVDDVQQLREAGLDVLSESLTAANARCERLP